MSDKSTERTLGQYPLLLGTMWPGQITRSQISGPNTGLGVAAGEEIRDWEKACKWVPETQVGNRYQIMAPLPDVRVRHSLQTFAHVSVHHRGPFITVQGRGKQQQKRWLCLLTCLSSRSLILRRSWWFAPFVTRSLPSQSDGLGSKSCSWRHRALWILSNQSERYTSSEVRNERNVTVWPNTNPR